MIAASAVVAAGSLFLLDAFAGMGSEAGVAYVLVIWIASIASRRVVLWAAASACSLLVLIGAGIAPAGDDWTAAGGRALAILTIWLTVGLIAFNRRQRDYSYAYFAAVVTSCNDAIIGKTLDGIVTSWNRGAETLWS